MLSIEFAFGALYHILNHADSFPMKKLLRLDIWIIPLVNVDGNTCLWERDENVRRKNWPDRDQDGTIDPFERVDLNRNYPFAWNSLANDKGSNSWT